MRIASRIVGVVLAIAGLGWLGLSVFALVAFSPESVLQGQELGRRLPAGLSAIVFGLGLVLAGWYFFRLDVDKLDDADDRPASRFAPFLLAHRRTLKVIAQAGLAISLIRLVAVYFGRDWPTWPLVLAWFGLLIIGRQIAKPGKMDLDWQAVPERMRPALKALSNVGGVALLILALLFVGSHWSHRLALPHTLEYCMPLLFAWVALFFAYGRLATDPPAPPPARL